MPPRDRGDSCKQRLKSVARNGACVSVEKRGALEATRRRISKTCDGVCELHYVASQLRHASSGLSLGLLLDVFLSDRLRS